MLETVMDLKLIASKESDGTRSSRGSSQRDVYFKGSDVGKTSRYSGSGVLIHIEGIEPGSPYGFTHLTAVGRIAIKANKWRLPETNREES